MFHQAVQDGMDQLDRTCTPVFLFLDGIQTLDLGGLDIPQDELAKHRQDMLSVLRYRMIVLGRSESDLLSRQLSAYCLRVILSPSMVRPPSIWVRVERIQSRHSRWVFQ